MAEPALGRALSFYHHLRPDVGNQMSKLYKPPVLQHWNPWKTSLCSVCTSTNTCDKYYDPNTDGVSTSFGVCAPVRPASS